MGRRSGAGAGGGGGSSSSSSSSSSGGGGWCLAVLLLATKLPSPTPPPFSQPPLSKPIIPFPVVYQGPAMQNCVHHVRSDLLQPTLPPLSAVSLFTLHANVCVCAPPSPSGLRDDANYGVNSSTHYSRCCRTFWIGGRPLLFRLSPFAAACSPPAPFRLAHPFAVRRTVTYWGDCSYHSHVSQGWLRWRIGGVLGIGWGSQKPARCAAVYSPRNSAVHWCIGCQRGHQVTEQKKPTRTVS